MGEITDRIEKTRDSAHRMVDALYDLSMSFSMYYEAVEEIYDFVSYIQHQRKCREILKWKELTLGLTYNEKKRLENIPRV